MHRAIVKRLARRLFTSTCHANVGSYRMDVDRSGNVDEPCGLAKGDARMMNGRDERRHHRSFAPTKFERLLALGSLLLLATVAVALVRGHLEWSRVPVLVWLHLATISLCLALTPMLLLGRRGARRHRQVGYAWVASMTMTALVTLGIRDIGHGGLSAIHILSAVTLIQAPRLAWHARRHRVDAHRALVQILVTGSLLTAGIFTLPFGRMLGRWLFG